MHKRPKSRLNGRRAIIIGFRLRIIADWKKIEAFNLIKRPINLQTKYPRNRRRRLLILYNHIIVLSICTIKTNQLVSSEIRAIDGSLLGNIFSDFTLLIFGFLFVFLYMLASSIEFFDLVIDGKILKLAFFLVFSWISESYLVLDPVYFGEGSL